MANKSILIIDDDVELCEEIAETLQDEGYPVEYISDPDQGQNLINRKAFDIVIIDYKMPGLNGIELLKKIKEKNPQTKVFIATGRPFIDKLLEEQKASHLVSGVVNKPFNTDTLLEKIIGLNEDKKSH